MAYTVCKMLCACHCSSLFTCWCFWQVFRQVRADGYIRSVSLDPEGAYVAASLADGSIGIWDITSGKQEFRKKLAPKVRGEPAGTHCHEQQGQVLSCCLLPLGGQRMSILQPC